MKSHLRSKLFLGKVRLFSSVDAVLVTLILLKVLGPLFDPVF